jgi:hypothetical protein
LLQIIEVVIHITAQTIDLPIQIVVKIADALIQMASLKKPSPMSDNDHRDR